MSRESDNFRGEPRAPRADDIALAPPIELGTILFSLVEPRPGHARAFNLWYERDHYFAGCMSGADFFSGRRFVATRDLKAMRAGSGLGDEASLVAGAYLHLYWILKGRREPALQWSVAQVRRLARQGRMGPPTQSVSTGFYDYVSGHFPDEESVSAELALEYPYRAATALLVDRAGNADPRSFEDFLDREMARLTQGSPRGMALRFRPLQLPPDAPRIAIRVPQEELDHRWLILLFSDPDPDADAIRCAPYDAFSDALASHGMGTLRFAAPFRPITPGVDDHSDRL